MPQKIYLDDSGNPIKPVEQKKVYLDDDGNPVSDEVSISDEIPLPVAIPAEPIIPDEMPSLPIDKPVENKPLNLIDKDPKLSKDRQTNSLSDIFNIGSKSFLPESKDLGSKEPETYASGFLTGLADYAYDELVRPAASPFGIGTLGMASAAKPITRGALSLVNKIPGAKGAIEKLAQFGETNIFGKSAGTKLADDLLAVKNTTAAALPKAETAIAEQPSPIISKLHQALDESKPLTEKQKEINRITRAEKFGKAENVPGEGYDWSRKFMGSLAGKHTKVMQEPLKLEQPDVDSLTNMIKSALDSDVIDTPSTAQAITGLKTLLDGGVPVPSQLEVLEKIFGAGIKERVPTIQTGRQLFNKAISIPKAIVSSLDLGFPFRQGINHVGQKEWFGMLRPAIEAYASEGSAAKWIDAVKASPNYDLKKRAGLSLGEVVGSEREEHVLINVLGDKVQPAFGKFGKVVNTIADKIGKAPGIAHSNRAYTVGATKLRSDLFDSMYKDYKRIYDTQKILAGTDKAMLDAAEGLNPDNLYRSKKMADLINTSTGRGNLGRLEPIAEELNATLFAPRLMSARFKTINRTLNPMSYYNGDPVTRKNALKQLMSITGTALSTAALFKTAGGDVELDPRSSDFLKGKIGRVRFDLMGGYAQYVVPASKILSATGQGLGLPIDHSAKSTKTGEPYNLGDNAMSQTPFDVAETFFTNKSAPIASLIIAVMRGTDPSGKEIDMKSLSPFENTIMKTIMPFMIQDFKELAEEDPSLIPFLIPGSALGGNIQVHQDRVKAGRR